MNASHKTVHCAAARAGSLGAAHPAITDPSHTALDTSANRQFINMGLWAAYIESARADMSVAGDAERCSVNWSFALGGVSGSLCRTVEGRWGWTTAGC